MACTVIIRDITSVLVEEDETHCSLHGEDVEMGSLWDLSLQVPIQDTAGSAQGFPVSANAHHPSQG